MTIQTPVRKQLGNSSCARETNATSLKLPSRFQILHTAVHEPSITMPFHLAEDPARHGSDISLVPDLAQLVRLGKDLGLQCSLVVLHLALVLRIVGAKNADGQQRRVDRVVDANGRAGHASLFSQLAKPFDIESSLYRA